MPDTFKDDDLFSEEDNQKVYNTTVPDKFENATEEKNPIPEEDIGITKESELY